MDAPFRYSMLDTAQRCPQKYKLDYVDKVKSDTESGDMKFGTAIHAGVQAILEGDNGQSVFKLFWDGEKDNSKMRFGQFNWDAYNQMGPAFLERFKRLHAKKYKPLVMEETLNITYNSLHCGFVKFEGTPDFVGEVNGVMSLVDFKTSRTAYDAAKLIVNPQMYLYSLMAEVKYAVEIKQIVYTVFVKHPAIRIQTLILPLDRGLRLQHMENLCAQARNLQSMEFTKTTSSCLMGNYKCEHFSRCWPYSAPVMPLESTSEISKE